MTKRFIEDGIMVKDTMNKLPPILTHSNQQQKEFLNALNELNDENQQLKDRDIIIAPQRHGKTATLEFLKRYNRLVGFENEVKDILGAKYDKCDTIGKEVIKDIARELNIELEDLE